MFKRPTGDQSSGLCASSYLCTIRWPNFLRHRSRVLPLKPKEQQAEVETPQREDPPPHKLPCLQACCGAAWHSGFHRTAQSPDHITRNPPGVPKTPEASAAPPAQRPRCTPRRLRGPQAGRGPEPLTSLPGWTPASSSGGALGHGDVGPTKRLLPSRPFTRVPENFTTWVFHRRDA